MRNTFRKCFILILLGFLLCIHCGNNKSTCSDDNVSNRDFVAKETFRLAVDTQDCSQLNLEGIDGNVTITGLSEPDSVIITGEKRVGSESIQDAKDHMQELEVSVIQASHGIFVETTQPDQTHGRSYVVDYDISLPEGMYVKISNVNGSVIVDSCKHFVYVVNVNGQISLNQIVAGVFVRLVNGRIQAEVTLPMTGSAAMIDMATVNGDIDLDIPQSTSARFMASVANGTINISNLALRNPVSTLASLSGTFGDGGGMIALSTVNGCISVSGF